MQPGRHVGPVVGVLAGLDAVEEPAIDDGLAGGRDRREGRRRAPDRRRGRRTARRRPSAGAAASAAGRRARELRLGAQRGLIDELRRRALEASPQVQADPRYPALLARLSEAARSQLGPGAELDVDPPRLGGVVGERQRLRGLHPARPGGPLRSSSSAASWRNCGGERGKGRRVNGPVVEIEGIDGDARARRSR